MKLSSKWHVLYEGSGSVSGNGWVEEVCYLGQEQWLLSLRDDPAWSIGELDVQEPEERSSAELASWVVDMDSTDGGEEFPRVEALLSIAKEVGSRECVQVLERFVGRREGDA
jgi:hypothetical protein